MLWIKYKKPTYVDENGKQHYLTRGITWSETHEEKIKAKGYEYSIVEKEDKKPTSTKPSLETRVGTLETDSTEMKEALDMILSGVTE